MIKFTLYLPLGINIQEIRELEKLLKNIESSSGVVVDKKKINSQEEKELKSKFLWSLSVFKRIGIKQTKRTKSLYPQLVIFVEDKPVTFYPQSYRNKEISIKQFLEAFLNKKILCFHDAPELKKLMKKDRNN